jgi:hypothetical protein
VVNVNDPPETVLVTVHASERSEPVFHLPDADSDTDGRPRCVTDADRTYSAIDRGDLPAGFRPCRTCDPDTHVRSGAGAVCDLLSDMDPGDVGGSAGD